MSIIKGNNVVNVDGSIFVGYNFNIGKTLWNVVTRTVKNEIKTVTVSKKYPNPWLTVGKDFNSFNEAINNYKNPTMKLNLSLIEIGI